MKRVFVVTGAEACGTILVTRAFCAAGVFGDGGHTQRLDDGVFPGRPEVMVLRRSFPHGGAWPELVPLVGSLREAGYAVVPVVVLRNVIANIESQVRNGHARTHRMAHDTIVEANGRIFAQLAEVGLCPLVVCFEAFVRFEAVRRAFFDAVGLPVPVMEFVDSSGKYRTEQEEVVWSC